LVDLVAMKYDNANPMIEAARTMRRVDVSMLGTPTEIMECENYCAVSWATPDRIRSPQRTTTGRV